MDARVRYVLSVTLEPKARIRTNDLTPSVRKTRPTETGHTLKIIYTRRTCLVDTYLTNLSG
ncbi:hypothetical protein GGE06_003520 [Streptomyces sp. SFB5A]|jgi:hypothetical protein|uniref:Uncharacterized protein n=1 Tax=Streptomyces nymphaeiformis TaxID=2663842 RepID=A0A7W7XC23_9ACTN|nr:hypothetical protein [Streptomyces nymphaeiformis]